MLHIYVFIYICIDILKLFLYMHPIGDRVAQNLEIMSDNFQFSTRHTEILQGFIISTMLYMVVLVNPMDKILVRLVLN